MRNEADYRPDIDGLRAIAVTVVVLFHAKLGLFSGGYVGVDIFFVISGYLISSIVWRELKSNKFTFLDFYERRVRRIFPALAVVLIFIFVVGALLLTPQDYKLFARSARATVAFYSNVFFFRQSGYFMPAAETQPLLHTWSLAVEEQFYLVAPFFLMMLTRVGRMYRVVPFLLVMLASLVVSQLGAVDQSPSAFYLLPSRAFELMVGMSMAMGFIRFPVQEAWRQAVGAIGLFMVLFAALVFDEQTSFPGVYALIPCLGAALLVSSANYGPTLVSRLLSTQGFIFVGKISYSLYLWHWPLLVFAEYRWGEELQVWHRVLLVMLAVGLAWMTYLFVEQPARRRHATITSASAILRGVAVMAFIAAFAQLISETHGWRERLEPDVARLAVIAEQDKMLSPCRHMQAETGRDVDCEIGALTARTHAFLLWGDSHAAVVASQVSQLAKLKDIKGAAAIQYGCAPFLPTDTNAGFAKQSKCVDLGRRVEALLRSKDFDAVILVARWALYAEGNSVQDYRFVANTFEDEPGRDRFSEFSKSLRSTVQRIRATGRRVIILGPVPELPVDLPNAMIKARMQHQSSAIELERTAFNERETKVLGLLSRLAAEGQATVFYPHELFCNASACVTTKSGLPLYHDHDHLGSYGVKLITPILEQALQTPAAAAKVLR